MLHSSPPSSSEKESTTAPFSPSASPTFLFTSRETRNPRSSRSKRELEKDLNDASDMEVDRELEDFQVTDVMEVDEEVEVSKEDEKSAPLPLPKSLPSTPAPSTPLPSASIPSTPVPFTPNPKLLNNAPPSTPQIIDPNQYLSAATQALLEERKGPLQRLVITYMVLENFKSYAGTQKIGPFHKSFTAVVGANGSGKSNIIDALLFVFGYRANKLRQSKLGHLIHHSDKFPDLSQCTVSVYFHEIIEYSDNVTNIVPNSEFFISRTAFRNHSSKYAINNTPQPFSEVVTLLKSKQVDLDNHRFLILQGEVESIAQMKAKAPNDHEDGLLEYLEDIIGTRHYKEPIADKLLILDEVNAQRNEKLARAVFVEQEKKRLEASKNQAERFLQKEQECHHYEAWLLNEKLEQAKLKVNDGQKKLTNVLESIEKLESTFKDMTSNYTQLEKDLKEAQEDLQSTQKEVQVLEKKAMSMATEDVKVREVQKSLKRKIEKVEKTIEKHIFTISEQERWLSKDFNDTEKFSAELATLQKKHEENVQTLEKMNMDLRFKTHDLQVHLDHLKTEALPLKSEWQQKKGDLELAQSELESLIQLQQRQEQTWQQCKEKLHTQSQLLATLQDQLNTLANEKETHQEDLKHLQAQRQTNEATHVRLKKDLHEVRVKLEELKATMHSHHSKNRVLEGLLQLKAQVPGIYDRLGNLGTIEAKYDIAASTAFSGLDYIVVDTVSTGQRCLEYLRTQGLGRVSLICLDKLAKFPMQPISTPERALRLFDLVHVQDEKFKPAFYHVMRDTLVAESLEQANRIAFTPHRRWRVVTLDGQLIDTSGTMSGGGSQVIRGKIMLGSHSGLSSSSTSFPSSASFKDDSSLLQKTQCEQRQEALTKELHEWQTQQVAFEAHYQRVTQAFTKVDQQWAMTQLQLQQLQLKQSEDEAQLKVMEKEYPIAKRQNLEKKAQLDQRIETLIRVVEDVHVKLMKMEALIGQKQDEIDDIGGMEYKVLKYQVQTEAADVEKLIHQVAKSQVQQKQAEKQKVQSASQVELLETELKDLQTEFETVKTQLETQKEQSRLLSQEQKKMHTQLDIHEKRVHQLQKEIEEHAEEVMEYKKQKAQYKRSKDQLENQLREWEQQSAVLQKRWDALPSSIQEGAAALLTTLALPVSEIQAKVAQLKHEVQQMAEDVHLGVLEEYKQREIEHQHRLEELDTVTMHRNQVKQECDTLKKQRLKEFMMGFALISQKLKEMYLLMTCGGNAELELVDSMDPFSEGILFSVMPPKKSWKQIHHLSGGEKTLASLALVFALHHYKPNPVYVMDEIDAALDFRNVSIIAQYIKEQTQTAQFIIISLRHNMFELSDRLVGIYKTEQCTKSISVDPHAFQIVNVPSTLSTSSA